MRVMQIYRLLQADLHKNNPPSKTNMANVNAVYRGWKVKETSFTYMHTNVFLVFMNISSDFENVSWQIY